MHFLIYTTEEGGDYKALSNVDRSTIESLMAHGLINAEYVCLAESLSHIRRGQYGN